MSGKPRTSRTFENSSSVSSSNSDSAETSPAIFSVSSPPLLTDLQATIGGGLAGTLANLATLVVGSESPQLSDIPWLRIFICAILGAATVYFLAERARRHVFVYGIAAPFVIIGVLNSYEVKLQKKSVETAKTAVTEATAAAADATENQRRSAENAGRSPRLGAEAAQAVATSEFPIL